MYRIILCTCTITIDNVLISGVLKNRIIVVQIHDYNIHDDGVFVYCVVDGYGQSIGLVDSGVVKIKHTSCNQVHPA